MFYQLRQQQRKLFICHSSTRVESDSYQKNIHGALPCTVIYSKDYQHGTLFAIKLLKRLEVSRIDTAISDLDKQMQEVTGVFKTKFTSISDIMSGKIKTFGHRERKVDMHYLEIFSPEGHPGQSDTEVLPGVKSWSPGGAGPADDGEFDVVKKRRIMNSTPGDDDEPTALAAFEDFERNVLPAMEYIREAEDLLRQLEILEVNADKRQGKTETTGGVYFAWSSCLKCMKIGATRRDSPDQRLREISRYVTEKFVLAAWIPTPSHSTSPFDLEAAAHRHFKEKRINSRSGGTGAGTEFFWITSAEAAEWARQQWM